MAREPGEPYWPCWRHDCFSLGWRTIYQHVWYRISVEPSGVDRVQVTLSDQHEVELFTQELHRDHTDVLVRWIESMLPALLMEALL